MDVHADEELKHSATQICSSPGRTNSLPGTLADYMQIAFSVLPRREIIVIVVEISEPRQARHVALRDNPRVQQIVVGGSQALRSQVPEGRAYLLLAENVSQEPRMSDVYFQSRLV